MSQSTSNTNAFIEAQQYSQFILENLDDGLLPDGMFRNVTDFPAGSTLNIKTVGAATIQEVDEDVAVSYAPIDTGNVTLAITDYVGDAWFVTDVLRQDGAQIEQLMVMRAKESTRAIQERFETRFLETLERGQTNADANLVNGFAHRIVSGETNDIISLSHFIQMKLAFDKANVPQQGRVAVVDPVVEATLNNLVQVTSSRSLDYNPQFQEWLEQGFGREHRFLFNLFGWDVFTSNRLPTETSDGSAFSDGTNTVASGSGVANIFMSVADDGVKPGMVAWRAMPAVEGERNKDRGRDEFVTRARWGTGVQRVDSLGIVVTSNTAIS